MLARSHGAAWVLALLGSTAACSSETPSAPPGALAPVDGSTPPDASSPAIDAGAPQPGLDGGTEAGADPCAGRLVCDSFEAAPAGGPPGAPWTLLQNSGSVVVSETRARTGTRSLKLTTTANTYQRAMITTAGAPLFPARGNVLHGRMYAWLENAAGQNVHWNMISARGPVPGRAGVTASYNYGGQLGTYLANYDTAGAKTDCWKHSAKSMPIGRWVCFAWSFSGPQNELRLSSEGGEIADMRVTNKGEGCLGHDLADVWLAPTFTSASVGWESVQNDPGHTMYVDDVVMDDEALACP